MDIKLILIVLSFFVFIPLPNWLKAKQNKKQLAYWNSWLSNKDSHESYLTKYPNSNQEVQCFFCGETKTFTQVVARVPKKIEWGFFNTRESEKQIDFISYYCHRCNSELFRHSHEV